MRLENKIAVVVGAGQGAGRPLGNGRATAIGLAREGAKVLCVDLDEASAAETARAIKDEGGDASVHVCSIAEEAECEGIITECVNRYGRLDILHNNVGIAPPTGGPDATVEEMTVEKWDHVMQINLRSMVLTIKHALPVMRAQRSGSIVNVSSGAALIAMPILAYTCSKIGVHALTQHTAALAARDAIRCNCIVVGNIDPTKARGTPWDIANAATFLHSEDARFITGVMLPVDGGFLAGMTILEPTGTLPRDF